MIRDAGSKFDDYSISLKIRQILLHWGYELTQKDCFNELPNWHIKMSYYWFNSQEILQKAKEKKKAAEHYAQNKEVVRENSRERYRNLSQEEQTRLKSIKEKNIKNWFSIKKKH